MKDNSIVPVKPSDDAIVSVSNQMSLTNKLLADIERDKKRKELMDRWNKIPPHDKVRLMNEHKAKTLAQIPPTDSTTDIDSNLSSGVGV